MTGIEAYDKRDGTFRKFKEKMAAQNPSAFAPKITDDYMEDLCANIKVGDRCEIDPGRKEGLSNMLVEQNLSHQDFWVGVQFDEPFGKHDGMVKGSALL
ncbi:hypothetical protein OIU84_011622 [Salix udensis]|uniref:CAP-Gly domain-containing protein n=1 Tax=Salix udensis TaxID=889485 RepID=A0AAD6NX65_9ROSI|nr:hypothetical protein OIU84_011622 [Salix udensis]